MTKKQEILDHYINWLYFWAQLWIEPHNSLSVKVKDVLTSSKREEFIDFLENLYLNKKMWIDHINDFFIK